jgi:M6 family metalloprotease-like protein
MIARSRYLYGLLLFFATICISLSITSVLSYAVPALEIPREVSQPSGEKFIATLHGDEWFNYTSAENGDLVVKGEDSYWYYRIAGQDGLMQSSAKFKIDSKPVNAQTIKDVKDLRKSSDAAFEKTNGTPVPNRSAGFPQSYDVLSGSLSAGSMSLSGTEKVLVLLVSFTNASIVNTDSAWSTEFFGDTGKTLKTYYKENSQNNFYFAPAAETKGTTNDGVVRVTLSYDHPNTGEEIDYQNQNIVIDAVTAADAYVNFSLFDTNGNGIISASELHILTVVAGNDCSYGDSSPCIWPHSWSTVNYIYKDGKNIYGDYTQIAEKQGGHMTTMGVVAHELGHDIGLPDLYDTDNSSDGIGVYSLMASGS